MKDIFKSAKVYMVSIILIIIDQMTKFMILRNQSELPRQIIKGMLKFSYCENRGVAFSLGDGNVALFVILNILLISILIVYYEKNKKELKGLSRFFVSMIIAGGSSNLIDRMFRGFVIDFIDVRDMFNFAIFNVADIFITVGVFGIAIYYIVKMIKK